MDDNDILDQPKRKVEEPFLPLFHTSVLVGLAILSYLFVMESFYLSYLLLLSSAALVSLLWYRTLVHKPISFKHGIAFGAGLFISWFLFTKMTYTGVDIAIFGAMYLVYTIFLTSGN